MVSSGRHCRYLEEQTLPRTRGNALSDDHDAPNDEAAPRHTTAILATQWPRPSPRLHRGTAAEVLDGRLEPGKVFDPTASLDDVPARYRAMDDPEFDQGPGYP